MDNPITNYKLSLQLYNTFNYMLPRDIIKMPRKSHFTTQKSNILKVATNNISNRFWNINAKIHGHLCLYPGKGEQSFLILDLDNTYFMILTRHLVKQLVARLVR